MPIDVLSNADNTRIQGSLTVVADPLGNAGNVNVAGTLTASGATVIGSNLTVSGTATVTGSTVLGSNLTVSGTVTVTGSTVLGSNLVVSGTESVTGSMIAGSDLKISGNLLSPMPAGSATNTSTVSIGLIPTLSTSVSDGAEVTILNISPSGTNLAIPSSLQGSISGAAVITVSAMQGARFVYSALLQTWLRAN